MKSISAIEGKKILIKESTGRKTNEILLHNLKYPGNLTMAY